MDRRSSARAPNSSSKASGIRHCDTRTLSCEVTNGRVRSRLSAGCLVVRRRGLCFQFEQQAQTQADESTRKGIIDFLRHLYRESTQWGGHARVDETVLLALVSLAEHPDGALQALAQEGLKALR